MFQSFHFSVSDFIKFHISVKFLTPELETVKWHTPELTGNACQVETARSSSSICRLRQAHFRTTLLSCDSTLDTVVIVCESSKTQTYSSMCTGA
jgi:hypothetical protein